MFQIGYYITDTNMGKVLDARVEPVLSSSAVESVVFRLNGPLVRRLFLCFFCQHAVSFADHGRFWQILQINTKCSYSEPPQFQKYIKVCLI